MRYYPLTLIIALYKLLLYVPFDNFVYHLTLFKYITNIYNFITFILIYYLTMYNVIIVITWKTVLVVSWKNIPPDSRFLCNFLNILLVTQVACPLAVFSHPSVQAAGGIFWIFGGWTEWPFPLHASCWVSRGCDLLEKTH